MHDRHTLMTGLKTYLMIHLKLSLLFAPRRTECLDGQTDRQTVCCMWPVEKQGVWWGKSTFQSLKNNCICSPCIKKSFSSQQESNKRLLVLFTYHITQPYKKSSHLAYFFQENYFSTLLPHANTVFFPHYHHHKHG